jgi:hypothetical protein
VESGKLGKSIVGLEGRCIGCIRGNNIFCASTEAMWLQQYGRDKRKTIEW